MTTTTTARHSDWRRRHTARKPDGGFVLIPAWALLAVWWASRTGDLRPVDLRVWLASFECVARRCRAQRGRPVRYTAAELRVATDARSERGIRASLRRLERTGLMTWSVAGPVHAERFEHIVLNHPGPLLDVLRLLSMHDRRVPVPRRLLSELCRCNAPGLLAAAFGHLLRALFNGRRECRSGGLCKASWVAQVFGLSVRTVRRNTALLVRSGALHRERISQHVMNRYGGSSTWNLCWDPRTEGCRIRRQARRVLRCTRLSPLPAAIDTAASPPRKTGNSLTGSDHQQRTAPRDGARTSPVGMHGPFRGSRGLGHVRTHDLTHSEGLQRLFERAASASLVRRTEAAAHTFAAAASHALRVGTRNPAGLFATIVRRGLWRYLSAEDEDRARPLARSLVTSFVRPTAPRGRQWRAWPDVPRDDSCADRITARRLVLASLASVGA